MIFYFWRTVLLLLKAIIPAVTLVTGRQGRCRLRPWVTYFSWWESFGLCRRALFIGGLVHACCVLICCATGRNYHNCDLKPSISKERFKELKRLPPNLRSSFSPTQGVLLLQKDAFRDLQWLQSSCNIRCILRPGWKGYLHLCSATPRLHHLLYILCLNNEWTNAWLSKVSSDTAEVVLRQEVILFLESISTAYDLRKSLRKDNLSCQKLLQYQQQAL